MKAARVTAKDITTEIARIIPHANKWDLEQVGIVKSNKQDAYGHQHNAYTPAAMAARFNDIIDLVRETEARVKVTPEAIYIEYQMGNATLSRNELIDRVLLPRVQSIA